MATNAKGWEVSGFDEGSHSIAIDKEQKSYRNFLKEYTSQLREMKEALFEGDFNLNVTIEKLESSLSEAPIDWNISSYDNAEFSHLATTENIVFNKVLVVFSVLCNEVTLLKRELYDHLLPAFLFYGEDGPLNNNDSANSDTTDSSAQPTVESVSQELPRPPLIQGDAQVMMGRMLSLVHRLSCFVNRVTELVVQIVKQLNNLYTKGSVISSSGVHLTTVWESIGSALSLLHVLDLLLCPAKDVSDARHLSIAIFSEHWEQYKRMLVSIQNAPPGKFPDVDPSKMKPFERLMQKWEGQLLEGQILNSCLNQQFDSPPCQISRNILFAEEMLQSIYNIHGLIDQKMGQLGETKHRTRIPGLLCLVVLYTSLFRKRDLDKKLVKQLWDIHRRIPALNLIGSIVFIPDVFILRHIPDISRHIEKKLQQAAFSHRQQALQNSASAISEHVESYRLRFTQWNIQIASVARLDSVPTKHVISFISSQTTLLLQGLLLAYNLSYNVKTILALHMHQRAGMTKTTALYLCKAAELLQALHAQYKRRWPRAIPYMALMIQRLQFNALNFLIAAKKRLSSDKVHSCAEADILAAYETMIKMVKGPSSSKRRLITKLAYHFACQQRILADEEVTQLAGILRKIEAISELRNWVSDATDTTFLYWHRHTLLPLYLEEVFAYPTQAPRLQYMMHSLKACMALLNRAKHLEKGDLVKAAEQQIYFYLRSRLLDPLCLEVERDLRLSVHSQLKQDERNPFRIKGDMRDLTYFIHLPAVNIFTLSVDIRSYVRHYLDTTFYNLNTVALYDWKTYGDMRQLAFQKYSIEMTEPHLPSQTLEQGIDVLEIMRNIQIFVCNYNYNLNNQIFVQQSSDNKALNTINIRHVANSIRTHGTGIMNTTVNFTFQFLRKKFYIFSQFLGDEYIKGKLIKELRFFREHKYELDHKYPYERAEKFIRSIRKLGSSQDGMNYLDKFRTVITQIGNAMGYIRMIRSGGLHCTSNAIRFVPDLEDIVSFQEFSKLSNLPPVTETACLQLDGVIHDLATNFAEGTDYFKLLVEVFVSEMRSQKNRHLLNFYIIIPALTLSYVEHLTSAKDKMNKKNKLGAAFTDDGFCMGIAYILKLMDQYSAFDSLHWFNSISEKQFKDSQKLKESRRQSRADTKLDQTIDFSAKRLLQLAKEFKLLNFSLSSARIFFRADKTAMEEAEEQRLKNVQEGNEENNEPATPQTPQQQQQQQQQQQHENQSSRPVVSGNYIIPDPPPDIPRTV